MRMSRFSRINTIWRKELLDTLRDRRTLVAMVLVPMALYPALMLGSLQAIEVQVSYLVTEKYTVAVGNENVQRWLRRLIDEDPARQERPPDATAEQLVEAAERREPKPSAESQPAPERGGVQTARANVRDRPPDYEIVVLANANEAVTSGAAHVAVQVDGPLVIPGVAGSARVAISYDDSDIRSQIAAAGLYGVLERADAGLRAQRLRELRVEESFFKPIDTREVNIATAERMAGSVLGQIVPLILIIMTITGAIYPAIDLTAGERERGTLETLMVAPVPTIELIAGKFIVVTLIGLLSALLNLLSVGGTIYLGGVGSALMHSSGVAIPIHALPWIFLLLVPMAVLFSAALLAVCSFARSFKEAQNYIVPVMMAALIPGVVGILPGTRLEGPILIMPVANIVVLIRELFLDKYNMQAIATVVLSTSLYAAAAVAIAARLFGQEAVLFADAGSVKTLFQRRFFRPAQFPSAAQALLLMAITFSLNFFLQQALNQTAWRAGLPFLQAFAVILVLMFVLLPLAATWYMRVDVPQTFNVRLGAPGAWIAALCFGSASWVLVLQWTLHVQPEFLPVDPQTTRLVQEQLAWLAQIDTWTLVFFMAVMPAICEELFFRGYALSGLRSLGRVTAVLVTAVAFGLAHHSAQRFVGTAVLGLLFGLLVTRFGSVWPAMLAHALHNGISILAFRPDGLQPLLIAAGFPALETKPLPANWLIAAAALVSIGIAICVFGAPRRAARGPR